MDRYDALPYETRPCRFTDPAHLEALARLWGLDAAPSATARVLELGGGDGGNILPMAERAPGGRFLCIDTSAHAVARGRAVVEAVGLDNVEVRHQGIEDLPLDEGPWDYIVAHGVYSWVGPAVRRRLLEICGRQLAPNGVAYVSYNTKPGWLQRDALRQVLLHHTRGVEDPRQAAQQAQGLLDFLVESQLPGESVWKSTLVEERRFLRDYGLDYMAHEFLSPDNEAPWFHEFVERAGAVGLQYLGEANPTHQYMALHEPSVESTLDHLAPDRLRRESVMDWVRGRAFRKTLLCREGLPLRTEVRSADFEAYWLTARIEPVAPRPDLADGVEQVFRGRGGEIRSTSALVKAVLWALAGAGTADLRLEDLWGRASALLDRAGLAARDEDRDQVAVGMLEWWKRGEIDLVCTPRPTSGVTARPRASALARHVALSEDTVANLHHEGVYLRLASRRLLSRLDGTRDRDALLHLALADQPGADTDHDALRAHLDRELRHLARSGLLVREPPWHQGEPGHLAGVGG